MKSLTVAANGHRFMTSLRRLSALSLLIALTLTGCKEEPQLHPAQGRWNGEMVSQGVVIDIGEVEIGANHIYLPDSNIYHGSLNTVVTTDKISFSTSNSPDFNASLRLIGQNSASLQMQGINGYIELTRKL
ncbi:MAG: hypothetical protein V7752_01650 [Halopseudomonas sp.]